MLPGSFTQTYSSAMQPCLSHSHPADCKLVKSAVLSLQIRRTIAAPHVKKDFAGLLAGSEGDRKKVAQLADLLERMMALDPDKRITPKDALKHPFIKEPKI